MPPHKLLLHYSAIFLSLGIFFSWATAASGADYLVKVDAFGYRDASEEKPKEKLLNSIEVVARLEQAFRVKVTIGAETVVLAGTVHAGDEGLYTFQIRYVRAVDTGETIPTHNGGREPRLAGTTVETTVSGHLGDPVVLGESSTSTQSSQGNQTTTSKSMFRAVLVLTKYEPEDL